MYFNYIKCDYTFSLIIRNSIIRGVLTLDIIGRPKFILYYYQLETMQFRV